MYSLIYIYIYIRPLIEIKCKKSFSSFYFVYKKKLD